MSPLGVTAWPDSPDPRQPEFSIIGYGHGAVPPYKWLIVNPDALPPFDDFHDGVVLFFVSDTSPTTDYQSTDTNNLLVKTGFADEQTGPPPFSVRMKLDVIRPGNDPYTDTLELLFPYGIRNWAFSMTRIGPGPDQLPGTTTIKPLRFDQAS